MRVCAAAGKRAHGPICTPWLERGRFLPLACTSCLPATANHRCSRARLAGRAGAVPLVYRAAPAQDSAPGAWCDASHGETCRRRRMGPHARRRSPHARRASTGAQICATTVWVCVVGICITFRALRPAAVAVGTRCRCGPWGFTTAPRSFPQTRPSSQYSQQTAAAMSRFAVAVLALVAFAGGESRRGGWIRPWKRLRGGAGGRVGP